MPENKAKANRDNSSEPLPLDAEHLCNLCSRRAVGFMRIKPTEVSIEHVFKAVISVRRHDCSIRANTLPHLVTDCRSFLCQHSKGVGTLSCEKAPCQCVKVLA